MFITATTGCPRENVPRIKFNFQYEYENFETPKHTYHIRSRPGPILAQMSFQKSHVVNARAKIIEKSRVFVFQNYLTDFEFQDAIVRGLKF